MGGGAGPWRRAVGVCLALPPVFNLWMWVSDLMVAVGLLHKKPRGGGCCSWH